MNCQTCLASIVANLEAVGSKKLHVLGHLAPYQCYNSNQLFTVALLHL